MKETKKMNVGTHINILMGVRGVHTRLEMEVVIPWKDWRRVSDAAAELGLPIPRFIENALVDGLESGITKAK